MAQQGGRQLRSRVPQIAAVGLAAVAITLAITWALWPREQPLTPDSRSIGAAEPAAVTEFFVGEPRWQKSTPGGLTFSGEMVVWAEAIKGRSGMFGADVRVHERFRMRQGQKGVIQTSPVLAGDLLVWAQRPADAENATIGLWLARPADGPAQLIVDQVRIRGLDADGDVVVWLWRKSGEQDAGQPNDQVWLYDTASGRVEQVPASPGPKTDIAVSHGVVAWSTREPDGDEETGVWIHDTRTKQTVHAVENPVASADLSGSHLVWCSGTGDVLGMDLRTRTRTTISTAPGTQADVQIDGDLVVWWDGRSARDDDSGAGRQEVRGDIYAYDLSSGDEITVCTNKAAQRDPKVSGDTIVWLDDRSGGWEVRGAVVRP